MAFYGVGKNTGKFGYGTSEKIGDKWLSLPAYCIWSSMMSRCYKDGGYENYKNVFISVDWLDYQDFAHWYYTQPTHRLNKGWQVDKDLLQIGKEVKFYGPSTCCMLPIELNMIIRDMADRESPRGVSWHKKDKSYRAYLKTCDGGVAQKGGFKDVGSAYLWYKSKRDVELKLFADKYKDKIEFRAYEALISIQTPPYKGLINYEPLS